MIINARNVCGAGLDIINLLCYQFAISTITKELRLQLRRFMQVNNTRM